MQILDKYPPFPRYNTLGLSSHVYFTAKPLNIVAVSGGLNTPSKTEALVQEILNELGNATPINVHFIKFSEIGHFTRWCDLPQPTATTCAR